MSNEELLKMYEAIKADPGELVRAAARRVHHLRRLISRDTEKVRPVENK